MTIADQRGETPRRLWRAFEAFHDNADFKLPLAGAIGVVAFPAYYVVWTALFPQPAECIELRIAGMVSCGPMALRDVWPARLRPFYLPYCYGALAFCLPTFFTAMLLLNDASQVWTLSLMAAILFTALLYDPGNAVLVNIAGSTAGIGVYLVIRGGEPLPAGFVPALLIYPFALIAIWFLASSERQRAQAKLAAAQILASHIAHEMRTPLLGIRFDAEGVRRQLTGVAGINSGIDAALGRIIDHTHASNLVIDMILLNLAHEREPAAAVPVALQSMQRTVETALDRYHFRSGERDRVRVEAGADFLYAGSDVLMIHVLFNLLRNALKAIEVNGGTGEIAIALRPGPRRNELVVADTAGGIEPEMLPHLFVPFGRSAMRLEGTGVGLSFCRSVVERLKGTLTVRSTPGEGAAFTISLPAPQSAP